MQESTILSSAFRKSEGFLFLNNGAFHRQINLFYKDSYDKFMDSGLFDRLVSRKLLIPHYEAPFSLARSENAYKILFPEQLSFISYPYEWCFSQLRDAALALLKTQKRALERGMVLKEASAFHMQFFQGRPMLSTPLVFQLYSNGEGWPAYNQFCRNFVAPLALASWRDPRLLTLLRTHLDGIPLDMAAKMLPGISLLKAGTRSHILLHARRGKDYLPKKIGKQPDVFPDKDFLLKLADDLRSFLLSLNPPKPSKEKYDPGRQYSTTALEHKKDLVFGYIKRIQPKILWDMGAHTGGYARMAAGQRIQTIAWDLDHDCVEEMYSRAVQMEEQRLIPLVGDLSNPSPNLGWDYLEHESMKERGPADMVLALDLIQHLTVNHNVPIGKVIRFLSGFCRFLVIEFVPPHENGSNQLPDAQQDLSALFGREPFEEILFRFFRLMDSKTIRDSNRTLYLVESLNK